MGGYDPVLAAFIFLGVLALAAFFLLRWALRAFGRAFKRTVWYRPRPGEDD